VAAELKEALNVEAQLVAGGGGIFDVEVDGALVFSKLGDDGRFPEDGEVLERVR
jgi:selT/selW/selH-like putative selenoprotein